VSQLLRCPYEKLYKTFNAFVTMATTYHSFFKVKTRNFGDRHISLDRVRSYGIICSEVSLRLLWRLENVGTENVLYSIHMDHIIMDFVRLLL